MTPIQKLIYKDRVQSLAMSMLQNATAKCEATTFSVRVTVIFDGLGETTFYVPWGHVGDEMLPMFVDRELRQCLYMMARARYFL